MELNLGDKAWLCATIRPQSELVHVFDFAGDFALPIDAGVVVNISASSRTCGVRGAQLGFYVFDLESGTCLGHGSQQTRWGLHMTCFRRNSPELAEFAELACTVLSLRDADPSSKTYRSGLLTVAGLTLSNLRTMEDLSRSVELRRSALEVEHAMQILHLRNLATHIDTCRKKG